MRLLVVAAALALCGVGLNSSLDPQTLVLDVQIGANVTISCSNFTSFPSRIIWFRVDQQLNWIGHMFQSGEPATLQNGFSKDKFEISSNLTTVFLKINQVNSSDTGLYFCGYYSYDQSPVIKDSTHLKVEDQRINEPSKASDSTLVGVTISLIVISVICLICVICVIYLTVRIKKLLGVRRR